MSCESGSQRVLNRGGHFWYNFNFPIAIGLRKNYRNIRLTWLQRTSTIGLVSYRLPTHNAQLWLNELNYPTAWRKSVVINESFNILWWDLLSCLWSRSRWTYNFVEVSGIILRVLRLEVSAYIQCVHYKPVSNHFCSRGGGVKSEIRR